MAQANRNPAVQGPYLANNHGRPRAGIGTSFADYTMNNETVIFRFGIQTGRRDFVRYWTAEADSLRSIRSRQERFRTNG